jgi:hypothetical protein
LSAVVLGVAVGFGALVGASLPHQFMDMEILSAANLNNNLMALDQRLAKLETSLAVSSWTPVPIAVNTTIDVWPDVRWGSGIEYKNIGPLTCLDGLIRTNSANFTGVIAVLPAGARPHVFLNLPVASTVGEIQLEISTDGSISFRDTPTPSGIWVSLGGLCFPNQ